MYNFKRKSKDFLFLTGFLFFSFFSLASAIDLISTNFIVRDPIIGTLGHEGASSASFNLISSGHTSLSDIGGTSTNFQIRYGFLYYEDEAADTITFDIDTDPTDTETATPYTVPLGVLTTSAVTRSNGSTNSIWVDLDSSTSTVVTVLSDTFKSASVPGDTIDSATTTMAAGTENYGLCIASATATISGTFNEVSPYDGATCVDGAANTVGIIDGTSRDILNSNSAAIEGGRAQIRVNAAISPVTPAHNDYQNNLTFIATGTF